MKSFKPGYFGRVSSPPCLLCSTSSRQKFFEKNPPRILNFQSITIQIHKLQEITRAKNVINRANV
jgi:hypothetical protein